MNLLDKIDKKRLMLIKQIGAIAHGHHMRAYLVGGPVRDLILNRIDQDLDITVKGNGIALARMFARLYPEANVVTYPSFKTATVVLSDKLAVDIVTARQEVYIKGGKMPKVIASGINDDLFRRDFTINAIACSINSDDWGSIVDPYGGLQDIDHQLIRILHPQSFLDDPTRILRAVRFSERLGFAIERGTLKMMKEAISQGVLLTISRTRYKKEFDKIKNELKAHDMIKKLSSLGALLEGSI